MIIVGAQGDSLRLVVTDPADLLMTKSQAVDLAAKLAVLADDWPDLEKTKAAASAFIG